MKQFRAAVILIALAAALFFGLKSKDSVTQISPTADGVSNSAASATTAANQTVEIKNRQSVMGNLPGPVSRASSPNPPAPEATNLPPATVLENMRSVIRNYASTFGENPVGTNPEITGALVGGNPKQINFITPGSGLHVNEDGALVDSWGTPFFFHQISGHQTEIRSAGMDRKMWTFDDLVLK